MAAGTTTRIPGLDGLRAVAVALVLLSHVLIDRFFWQTVWYGELGVTLFFVLSGFLITHLLLAERERTGTIALGAFFGRRALRILPVWLTYVVLATVLAAPGVFAAVDRLDVVASALFFRNLSTWGRSPLLDHGWSLSIEEQFYLVWPAVVVAVLAVRRGRVAVVLVAVAATAPLWHLAVYEALPYLRNFGAAATPYHADALLWGCALAFALHAGEAEHIAAWVTRTGVAEAAALVLLVVGGVVAAAVPDDHLVVVMIVAGSPLQAVLCAVLLAAVVTRPGGRAVRALGVRPLVALGLASYSVYVWQQPFFLTDDLGPFSRFPLDLVGALAVGATSYLLIERASDRVRARLRRTDERDATPQAARPPRPAAPSRGAGASTPPARR